MILPRDEGSITMVVRSRDVDLVKSGIQNPRRSSPKACHSASEDYGNRVSFLFDDTNAIKPEMIQEATANARQAAQRFADDSTASVGAIRKATQEGVDFQDRDQPRPS